MKGFIEAPTKDGNVLINVNHIVVITPSGDNTAVYFVDGKISAMEITMQYDELKPLIEQVL